LPDADLAAPARVREIERVVGTGNLDTINANALAERLLGDSVYANIIMLGFAWQQGLVPISLQALLRAIELNNVSVERNKQAFAWGRIAFADPDFLPKSDEAGQESETLDQVIARRSDFLTAYQDAAYAARYVSLIGRVRHAEAALGSEVLTDAVTRSLFKLMAYKDEYEVARLYADPGFVRQVRNEVDGDKLRFTFHLAPPLLARRNKLTGEPRKMSLGPWMLTVFRLMAKLKFLRGTALDPFSYTAERKTERQLIRDYETLLDELLAKLTPDNHCLAVSIAAIPEKIRGFGHVKLRHLASAKADEAVLLEQFRAGGATLLKAAE
jgi:indolepyruvate ferredoxin oxidoreductase